MSEFTKPIEDLGKNTADYVEARIDDLKLRTAKGLSLTLGKLLYMLLVLFIVSVILTALAIGGVMWIGELIGSYAAGAGIVAAVFIVILAVVILLRERLFRNTFVPMEDFDMKAKFYICNHCGNLVTTIHNAGVPLVCCGEKMKELVPNTVEASGEKHLPVAELSGSRLTVTVGAVELICLWRALPRFPAPCG